MELLGLLGSLAFSLASAVVGVRLLALARRTRCAPELSMGISFISSGALGTISKERLWRELFLAMDEENAPKVLAALNEKGVLEVLFGRKVERSVSTALEKIGQQIEARPDLDRYVLYTGALLRGS